MSLPPPSGPPSEAARDEPVHEDVPSWGLGEPLAGILLSQVMAGLVAALVLGAGGWGELDDAPMWATALITFSLHATLAGVAIWAANTKGFGAVRDYGIDVRWSDAGTGVFLGVVCQLLLVPAVTLPFLWLTDTDLDEVGESARELTEQATTPVGVISLVLAVAIVAPIVEEVFFRGLLFGAFKKRPNLGSRYAVDSRGNILAAGVASSLVFGLIHFDPILIPALTAAGGVFAWLTQRSGRLGPAIWAHAAFNGTTLVNLLW